MCNLGRDVWEEGWKQGWEQGFEQGMAKVMTEGRVEDIRNVMDSLNLPLEEAMTALKIPASDQPKYRDLLLLQ